MTSAQRRTLEAVKAGRCSRQYTEKSNTVHGAHAATLWMFLRVKWIDDGKMTGRWCPLELTRRGEEQLKAVQS